LTTNRFLRLFLTLAPLLALLLVGCNADGTAPASTFVTPAPTPLPAGSTYTVKRGTITGVLQTRGRVVAVREANLFFKVGGWIKTLNVAAGDQVKAGDLLANLDTLELEDGVTEAQYYYDLSKLDLGLAQKNAAVKAVELEVNAKQVELARLDVQAAQTEYDRQRYGADPARAAGAALELQKANLTYEQAQARYRAAEAGKDAYQLQITLLERKVTYWKTRLDRATLRLKDAQLTAPFDGIIISLDAKVGDNVDPYTLIGVVADPTDLEVDLTVPEADFGQVALGQTARITLDAYPGQVYQGQVKAISDKAVVWQGKQAYHVIVVFKEPQSVPATIRMGADVQIVVRTKENVLIVPTQAIYTVAGESYVEVVGSGGRRQRVGVVTGLSNETETEIVGGLQEGDVVFIP